MHSYAYGLGGQHIWPTLNKYITKSGRENIKQVDERYVYYFA